MSKQGKARQNGGPKTAKAILDQRVSFVYRLLASGVRRVEMRRIVAEQARKERLARNEARSNKKPLPIEIWGDAGAPSERTIDAYIKRAKARLRDEGERVSKSGNLILGMQLFRMSDVYRQAYNDGAWATCARIIEETNRLYALHGAVKIELTGVGGGPVQTQVVESAGMTLPEIRGELIDLLNVGRARQGIGPPLDKRQFMTLPPERRS